MELLHSGKVRDVYADGGDLILVASDRVSVYDVVLPTPIPDKGALLTQLSLWWFEQLADLVPNHVISTTDVPPQFAGRAAEEERAREREFETKVSQTRRTGMNAALASFAVLFVAEWGDLSQLLTAGLVARGLQPVAVFAGSWAGLAAISAAAVLLGRVLMRYVSLAVVQYVGAAVCGVLAIVTVIAALT